MTPAEKLAAIRAIVNTEDDGPEGSMGPAWIIRQVLEVIAPNATLPTDEHPGGCHEAKEVGQRGPRDCSGDGHRACMTCARFDGGL